MQLCLKNNFTHVINSEIQVMSDLTNLTAKN